MYDFVPDSDVCTCVCVCLKIVMPVPNKGPLNITKANKQNKTKKHYGKGMRDSLQKFNQEFYQGRSYLTVPPYPEYNLKV